jgi:hypothetical protein
MTLLTNDDWIWLDQKSETPHQYVCFRKNLLIDVVDAGSFAEISADSDFVLYVNGREAARGQFSDYPERKTFTRVKVADFLHAGENSIAILGYYRGEDFFEYRKGRPGLAVALSCGEIVVKSDSTWKAILHPAFKSGAMPRVTGQMGFTTCFDARLDVPWTTPNFDDSAWPQAAAQNPALFGTMKERPVPPLTIVPETLAKIVAQGNVVRTETDGTFARVMSRSLLKTLPEREVFALPTPSFEYEAVAPKASDFMNYPGDRKLEVIPPENADGRFMIVSIGREEVGLLTFELDAPEGTVLDLGHGEHMDDGRVRMNVGGRNFADRYICREGLNKFTLPFRRLGARYIEVHITNFSRPVFIDYIGMKPVKLETDNLGWFRSSDHLAERAYTVGKRTLSLCMHEHYEDCPWREQALYGYDSRNQALYGYHAFGNYDFAAASFDLLGKGIHEDGLLELCAPGRMAITIPIFSLVWINSVAEHWLYSGNSVLFDTFSEQIQFMIKKACEKQDGETGLYRPRCGDDIWHFYEWMDGLAGLIGGEEIGDRLDAPYNLFLHEALGSYASMLELKGLSETAAKVRARRSELGDRILGAFWNKERQLLATYITKGEQSHYAELVQVLALSQGIIPASKVPGIMKAIYFGTPGALYPMTLSSQVYRVHALMNLDPFAREFIGGRICRDWGAMLYKGATSFWETRFGGDDFDLAGSLCHGWSALPAYYFGAYALGIFPMEPGFGRFKIKPYPGHLCHARGAVPTPAGVIEVDWRSSDVGLVVKVKGPESLQPEVETWPEIATALVEWNGRKIFG